jgi:hypothetical protein
MPIDLLAKLYHEKEHALADYYLEFSQVLPHLSDEEFDWLNQELEIVHVFGNQEFAPASLPAGLEPAQADWSGYRLYRDYEDDVPDAEDLGFCFEFRDEEDSEFGRHL